ncbi:MAG: hypothetical protein V7605_1514 [Acidimicrobiaceae bacterium]
MRGVRRASWLVGLVVVILGAAACSSGSGKSSAPTTVAATASTATTSVANPAGQPTTTTTGLSGTWSGDYRQTSPAGAGGTFTILWQQAGSGLTGTITIPGACPSGCPITATLDGTKVSFGLVAGGAVNYTGTVTGTTMAGTYATVDTGTKGTWTATRTG